MSVRTNSVVAEFIRDHPDVARLETVDEITLIKGSLPTNGQYAANPDFLDDFKRVVWQAQYGTNAAIFNRLSGHLKNNGGRTLKS